MAKDLPSDLLTLKAAAALVGRSVDSVRRWRTTHGLRDYRDKRDPTSPSLFSEADVRALGARLVDAHAPDGTTTVYAQPVGVPTMYAEPRPALAPTDPVQLVHTLLTHLRDEAGAERDRLLADIQHERAEHAATRRELDAGKLQLVELSGRIARCEALLAGGKKSALAAERRRLLGKPAKPKR